MRLIRFLFGVANYLLSAVAVGALIAYLLIVVGCQKPAPPIPAARPAPVIIDQGPSDEAPIAPTVEAEEIQETVGPEIARWDAQHGVLNFGYTPNPEATEALIRSLPQPTLRGAAPHLFDARGPPAGPQPGDGAALEVTAPIGDGQPVLLYRAMVEAFAATHSGQAWVVGKQGIGDCVGWGHAHGAQCLLAVQWKLSGGGAWYEVSSEACYGGSRVEARGGGLAGYGDGSYGASAVKFLKNYGAVYRIDYRTETGNDETDLRVYSSRRAKSWGNFGNGGQPDRATGKLDAIAKLHPVRSIALCATFEEAAAAIANGYPVTVCSGQGFSSTRDADGFCRPSGSWSHCMVFVGVRFDRKGLLCLNSWGPSWVRGPKWPSDQPDGSFWVDEATATRMLRGRDSWALGDQLGFPARKLNHRQGWGEKPAPVPKVGVRCPRSELLCSPEQRSYPLAA